MKNQKHFKACHRTTGEEIFFGVEDIKPEKFYIRIFQGWLKHPSFIPLEKFKGLDNLLKDYQLYYYHDGEWFPYNTEEVEK